MKKKLLTLCLALCMIAAGAAGLVGVKTANAAVIDREFAQNVITDGGNLNELDWNFTGETKDTSYTMNIKGDVLVVTTSSTKYFTPCKKVNIVDAGKVKIEFDLSEVVTNPLISPSFWGNIADSGNIIYVNDGGLVDGAFISNVGAMTYYSDEACETELDKTGLSLFMSDYGKHVEFIYKANCDFGIVSTPYKEDKTLDTEKTVTVWVKGLFEWTKNFINTNYSGLSWSSYDDGVYFPLGFTTNGSLLVDNYKLSYGEEETVVFETDFSDKTWETSFGNVEGKTYNTAGVVTSISEIIAKPANGDRIVTDLKIAADEAPSITEVFSLSTSLKLTKLGKKFGFAFGLAEKDSEITGGGISYLYFTQNVDDNLTYVTVRNGDEDGTPVSLGANLMDDAFHDFVIKANKDGTGSVQVDGAATPVSVEIANAEGHAAIVTEGDGDAEVVISSKTNILGYAYRGSKVSGVENNFNTGYLRPTEFSMNSKKATGYANSKDARGVVIEDGKFRFAGAGDGSYLATVGEYSDYIIEFKLTEYAEEDHPQLVEGANAINSRLSVNLGVWDAHGWATSIMLVFDDNNITMLEYKNESGKSTANSIEYAFRPTEKGTVKTTAVKIVVFNGEITICYQEVKDGEELTKDKYTEAEKKFKVKDSFGKVAFAVSDKAYFDLDDVRITPVDDPDASTMLENLDNYEDLKEIPDTVPPVKLNAPTLTHDGDKTVNWAAVENAAGYIVNVNGTKTEVGAEVLTYSVTADGNYSITVTAKGDGGYAFEDSDASEAVKFTVGNPDDGDKDDDNNGTGDGGKKKGCGGCGSAAGGGIALGGGLVLLCIGFTLILRRKKINK